MQFAGIVFLCCYLTKWFSMSICMSKCYSDYAVQYFVMLGFAGIFSLSLITLKDQCLF